MSLLPGFDMPQDRPPQAARLAPRLRALADRGIYFGTVQLEVRGLARLDLRESRYQTRGKHSKKKFDETCLAEYAETFPTVCGDFAFYQFPSANYWASLFEATPPGFLFGLKVPEDITVATWPTHARYGTRAGRQNAHFLDAATFDRFFARGSYALIGTGSAR